MGQEVKIAHNITSIFQQILKIRDAWPILLAIAHKVGCLVVHVLVIGLPGLFLAVAFIKVSFHWLSQAVPLIFNSYSTQVARS